VSPANTFTHERATSIGAARWGIYIDAKGAFHHFMKTDNTSLRRTNENVVAKESLEGVKRIMRKSLIESAMTVSGDIMENINPDAVALVLGDRGALNYTQNATSIVQAKEIIPLTPKAIPLFHPHSIVSTLPPPVLPTAALWSIGSAITPNTYYMWVTAHYAADDDLHHSIPVATNPTNLTVTPANEHIIGQWTAPVAGAPDHYVIWGSTVNDVNTSFKWGETANLNIILSVDYGAEAYTATDVNVTTVQNYAEVVTYTAGVDYTIDMNHGTIYRIVGGGIVEHQSVVVTYHFRQADNVTMNLGPGNQEPVYAQIRLHQLSGDTDDSDNAIETGLVVDLWRVDLNSDSVDWPYTEDEFFEGASIELECAASLTYNTFGLVKTSAPGIDNRELIAILST